MSAASTRLIMVGGFLGAGKTTLIDQAARSLEVRGQPLGLITNDHATALVDTALLSDGATLVEEVTGSCFCCNFGGFLDAVNRLVARGAETVMAEPVGSCADLSATILQPIKDTCPHIDLAPLSVLVAPNRVRELMFGRPSLLHRDAMYLLLMQLEEADRILLSKADTLGGAERSKMLDALRAAFPAARIHHVSSGDAATVEEWLGSILLDRTAGKNLVDIDHDRHAKGGAAIGWLNAVIALNTAGGGTDWRNFARIILERLQVEIGERDAAIGHIKVLVRTPDEASTLNLTHLGGSIEVHGTRPVAGERAELILNARVQMPPGQLREVVAVVFSSSSLYGVTCDLEALECLAPDRPQPTHRYDRIV